VIRAKGGERVYGTSIEYKEEPAEEGNQQ